MDDVDLLIGQSLPLNSGKQARALLKKSDHVTPNSEGGVYYQI